MVNNADTNNGSIFMVRGVNVHIIDASVMIHKNRPTKDSKTFSDYADFLKRKLEDEFALYQRLDIVFV